jgi:ABC-2 type transport system permease protein
MTPLSRYFTATRYALFEQARNRTALLLLLLFVPVWYYFFLLLIPSDPLPFLYHATGTLLQANGRELGFISAGLNAITLIVGFMLFASTRKNMQFDRRLTLCGFSQGLLIAAKLTALVIVSAIVSLYASLILFFYWHPSSLPLIWLGFFCSALSYGALGLFLGALVRGELEGFFLIIMISLIDTLLQNPLGNPVANQPNLRWFPSFAPMQISVAGGFGLQMNWLYLLYALAWPTGFALLGLLVFWRKTHTRSVHTLALQPGQV